MKSFPFKGKHITVMGLGLHGGGVGAAKFLSQAGAKVTVTDLKTRKELALSMKLLKGLPIRCVLGKHAMRDFTHADMVVYNPGVRAKYLHLEDSPYLAAAIKNKVPLETDIGIFFSLVPRGDTIGVTGSKGKSTTAALIAHILKKKYPKTVLAGNIRMSVLDVLPRIKKGTPVVLELSSWQLEGLARHKLSPHVAVITNILKEHLNTYKDFQQYIEAKKHILRFQVDGDIAILNEQISATSEKEAFENSGRGKKKWFTWRSAGAPYTSYWKLPGIHNRVNLAAAIAVAKLYGVSQKDIISAVRTFKGLEGRFEFVNKMGGITFINDTTATMPDASIAALRSLPDPGKIILIAGGVDKSFDYAPMADLLSVYSPKKIFLLPGSGTEKIKSQITKHRRQTWKEVRSMREAVRSAWKMAKKGDTILLSPGAASFNLFVNEFDRGMAFEDEIEKLH